MILEERTREDMIMIYKTLYSYDKMNGEKSNGEQWQEQTQISRITRMLVLLGLQEYIHVT